MGKFNIPERAVFVCTGSDCKKRGGKELYKALKDLKGIEAIRIECTDRCKFAPVCVIQPENIWLKEYSEKEVFRILERLG